METSRSLLGLTDTTVLYDNDQPEDLRYILGLLNSTLLTYRFRFIGKLKSAGILEYFWNSLFDRGHRHFRMRQGPRANHGGVIAR